MTVIRPDWPVAGRVRAFTTTREGGVSRGPWSTFNLGLNSDDAPGDVEENRRRLRTQLPGPPGWLRQVHGTDIVHLDDWSDGVVADGAWTDCAGQVAVVLTADCLPVLMADEAGSVVAAVHAGWRGLAAGILELAVGTLPVAGDALHAWIGPAICGDCYQVGDDVRDAMLANDPAAAGAFRPDGDRWRADLKAMAAGRLGRAGVRVHDAGRCTHCEPDHFYSFRRDRITGRMASVIWRE
jgi:polyphenol oxidase